MDKEKFAKTDQNQKLVVKPESDSTDGSAKKSEEKDNLLNDSTPINSLSPPDLGYQFGLTPNASLDSNQPGTNGMLNFSNDYNSTVYGVNNNSSATGLPSTDSAIAFGSGASSGSGSGSLSGSNSGASSGLSSGSTYGSGSGASNLDGTSTPTINSGANPDSGDWTTDLDIKSSNPFSQEEAECARTNPNNVGSQKRLSSLVKMTDLKSRNKKGRDNGPRGTARNKLRDNDPTYGGQSAESPNFQDQLSQNVYLKVSKARVPAYLQIIMVFSVVALVALIGPLNTIMNSAPPLVKTFHHAKTLANWHESKTGMQSAIDLSAKARLDNHWLFMEMSEFADALVQHGEYKEALNVLDKGAMLSQSDPIPYMQFAAQMGQVEHRLALSDSTYKPNLQTVLKAIAFAERKDQTLKMAELNEVLGLLNYDSGNMAAGDQNFADARNLFQALPGFELRQRQVLESQWSVRTHKTVSKLDQLRKPEPSLVAVAAQTDGKQPDQTATDLLSAKKFQQLTALFMKGEANRKVKRSGVEVMDDIYNSVAKLKSNSDQDWLDRLSLLKQWAQAEPHSAIPHMVLAHFYNNFAWKARSNSFARNVKVPDWITFKERLLLAQKELDDALSLGIVAPEWFEIAQTNFLGGSRGKSDNPDYDKLVATGINFYPNYLPIYLRKSYYLQPRWHGQASQWVQYITQEANKRGGADGDKFYARMVSYVSGLYKDIYRKFPTISKERVERGEKLLDQDYPATGSAASDGPTTVSPG